MAKANPSNAKADLETKALAVALELLRREIADLPLAKLANALEQPESGKKPDNDADSGGRKGGSGFGGRATDAIGGAMNMMVGKFAAVMGPMAILSQVVASNASGFQVLGTAVKLLAATLGPILLPIVAVLAAGLIDLSEQLWTKLKPGLEAFYTLIIETLLPVIQMLIDAFMEVIDFVGETIFGDGDAKRASAVQEGRDAGMTDDEIRKQAAIAGWSQKEIEKAIRNANGGDGDFSDDAGAGGNYDRGSSTGGGGDYGNSPDGKPEAKKGVAGSLGIVIQELKRSMGPAASFSGLAQMSKNVQLAALNQSPIEKMNFEKIAESVRVLEKVAVNTTPKKDDRF